MPPDRVIPFDTVFNFRDLGGYRTGDGSVLHWRRVFRADGLHRLRPEDLDRFATLGITTVIDLRTSAEVEGGRVPDGAGHSQYHHLPVFDVSPDWSIGDPDAPGFLADRYLEMLSTGRDSVASALSVLAEESTYPAVFHCSAGKDRTGIVAAILLWLLGVPDSVIATDYAMSGAAMSRLAEWWREHSDEVSPVAGTLPSSAAEARPETMELFLSAIRDEYGSAEGLIAGLGLDKTVPARIRDLLLDPAA